jgi:creatinine amidohydrolase
VPADAAQAIERRYERLRPAELRSIVETAPLAYVPLGPLEFHGEHLPTGVDWLTSHALSLRAAEQSGGAVLPPLYLVSGCLDLPFTLTYPIQLVHAWVRATIEQLVQRGFRAVVILTGHGPLDLIHMIKRACAEAQAENPGLAAYGLCWTELNAARLTRPETGDPWVGDHAARIETSWMLALDPALVDLAELSDDPEAAHLGVYGRNPRFNASRELGLEQIEPAASLLAERARALLAGERPDTFADLENLVRYAWSERPVLRGRASPAAELVLHNPGLSSRFISSLGLTIDGEPVDLAQVALVNRSPGETGVAMRAAELGPENGFYVRRGQDASISLGDLPSVSGPHHVVLEIGLGGVTRLVLDEPVEFLEHEGAAG